MAKNRMALADLMRGHEILFGTAMGRICLQRLLDKTPSVREPTVLFLDFAGIASATVSFLREGPLAYRKLLRRERSRLYPVFANLAPPVMDSLDQFLSSGGDAILQCEIAVAQMPRNVQLLGRLDPKQDLTFAAVRELGEVTAARLAAQNSEPDEVGVTAWNNRLAALNAKGLVMEFRKGRGKSYRLTLEVM